MKSKKITPRKTNEKATTTEETEEQQNVADMTPDEQESQQAPVVMLVNNIIFHGIKSKASDIHINPFENAIVTKYRIDGLLQESPFTIPKSLYNAVVSRLKTIAQCNIAERRLPHDGRIPIRYENKSYELRFSIVPTVYGESIVMRVLDKGGALLPLAQLGFSPYNLERLEACIRMPNGLILISSPTGHGKSTTLFTALDTINSPDRRIITIEASVDFTLEGLVQIQTKKEIGLDFARVLRAVSRQNPDVVVVDEMRDKETAQTALELALTGHLVLSTIHTNDAPTCLTRLVEMGIEPFLIVDALQLAVAQRLVRTLCSACKQPTEPTEELLELFKKHNIDIANMQIFKQVTGQGCKVCAGTGMKGRTGIHEVLLMDDTIKDILLKGGSAYEIMKAARKGGMRTLREDGLFKVAQGKLFLNEVMRTTQETTIDPREIRIAELESDLAVKNQQLEIRVKELQEAQEELKRLSQFKSELLSVVSHELRTPLTSIDGFTRLIQERFLTDDFIQNCNDKTKPTIEKVKQSLKVVHENTSRLARLVNDFLDFSRIEKGRELEMNFAPLELSDIIDNVISTYQEPASQKNVSLYYEGEIPLHTNSLQVYGDADRISQALSNLVSNAIKFTQQGKITIGARKVDDIIEVNVKDTGVGIEEDKLSTIFEPFEQAGGPDKKGTGLGLALVKYIAQKHGGSIRVESKVGVGSNFILSIPEYISKPITTEPRRILIVDDDFDILKLLEEGLSGYQSYRIITASSGEEALKILEKQQCDVLMTDVHMTTGINGLDLAKKVRERYSNIKVFVMTATPEEKERVVNLKSDWIDKASPDLINYIAKRIESK